MSHRLKANLATSALAGAIAPLALAPSSLWPLALLSIALLWHTLTQSQSTKHAAFIGFAYGLGYFGVGVSWVFVSMETHGGTPWLLALVFTLLFCSALALYYALLQVYFFASKRYTNTLAYYLWACGSA